MINRQIEYVPDTMRKQPVTRREFLGSGIAAAGAISTSGASRVSNFSLNPKYLGLRSEARKKKAKTREALSLAGGYDAQRASLRV